MSFLRNRESTFCRFINLQEGSKKNSKKTLDFDTEQMYTITMKKKTIFHLDADAFFASVEQGFNPLLQNRPVIVGGYADQRGCVHTASYEARQRGIRTGMSLRTAKQRCPDAVFLKGDFRQYKAAGKVIREILLGFTPVVEMSSLDDVYLDLTGFERLYNSPVTVAMEIKREIKKQLGITVSIGVATSKLVAGIASRQEKPNGLAVIPPGCEEEFLGPLSVEELPVIGRAHKQTLTEMGIDTIEKFRQIPRDVLIQIFGINGYKLWNYSRGIDTRPVEPVRLPRQISRETTFEEDEEVEEIIVGTFAYLSERIGTKLRQNRWAGRKIGVKIRYTDLKESACSRVFPEPTDDGNEIYRRVMHIYRKIAPRRVRIRLIGIRLSEIDRKERQNSLFRWRESQEDLNKGIDSVRYRFGFTSISPGMTLPLKSRYRMEKHGYILHTSSLSQ